MPSASPPLVRYAWLVIAANLLVIVWGAYVRASGSGAGCGSNWPLCNGEVIPQAPQVKTLVELGHRVSSSVALVLVLGLAGWTFRAVPRGNPARGGAVASVVFIIGEALIGAGLVLFELVAQNASLARAFSMAAHLTNTFFLLGSLTLTAWWLGGGERLRLRGQGPSAPLLGGALGLLLLLGVSGAIAALGDTLFPAGSLAEGVAQDLVPTANALVRLRALHPALAAATGVYVVLAAGLVARWRATDEPSRRFARALAGLFVAQVALGMVNLALLAPIATQLAHLLLADAVWITLVLLAAAALAERHASVETTAAAGRVTGLGSRVPGERLTATATRNR